MLTTCTHIWLSVVPIQISGQASNEAHIIHPKLAKGVKGVLSGDPDRDGHSGGISRGSGHIGVPDGQTPFNISAVIRIERPTPDIT